MTRTARLGAGLLAAGFVLSLAGCDAGPGLRPVSEAVAAQCDQVRSIGSLIAVGEAFVEAVDQGDGTRAEALADRAQETWFDIQARYPFGPDGSPPAGFEARQVRIGEARPRLEWFAVVMQASPLEDAATGTTRLLPEMRALLDAIDLPDCAVVELPASE
jgi:hypothetical protein